MGSPVARITVYLNRFALYHPGYRIQLGSRLSQNGNGTFNGNRDDYCGVVYFVP